MWPPCWQGGPKPGSLSPVSSSPPRRLGAGDLPSCHPTGSLFFTKLCFWASLSRLSCQSKPHSFCLILLANAQNGCGGLSWKTYLHFSQAPGHLLHMQCLGWRRFAEEKSLQQQVLQVEVLFGGWQACQNCDSVLHEGPNLPASWVTKHISRNSPGPRCEFQRPL